VALALLAGCDGAAVSSAGAPKPTLVPSVPLPRESAPGDTRVALAPWRSDASPWAAFPVGSWAHYRLSTGLEERWCVVAHTSEHVVLEIQARLNAGDPWDPAIVTQHHVRNRWSLVTEMGPAAARAVVPASSAAGSFPATRITTAQRVVVVADHIPGGLVADGTPDPAASGGIAVTRMLLGYGVASP